MLYLEDYLEMIEHLPQELRDRFTEMRELDLTVQNNMDSLEKKTRSFFLQCKRGELQNGASDNEYQNLRKEYYKVLEDADEKVTIATQIHELVERYLRRLDSELFKFKCELEADNNGITEILEKRSLEMDGGSTAATALMNVIGINQKENRFFGGAIGLSAPVTTSNNHAGLSVVGNIVSGSSLAVHSLPATPTLQPKDNRYRTTTRPEKRRDSSTTALTGTPLEKRPTLGTGLATTSAAVRPLTPGMGAHAVLSPAVGSVAAVAGASAAAVAYNLHNMGGGSASNAIAAAASQAIVATQQMQQGRRTASLKASYEAIHGAGGGPTEFWISRDIASAATAAQNSLQQSVSGSEKKQKKTKSNLSLTHVGSTVVPSITPSALSLASSSSSLSVDSIDMLPSSSAAAAASVAATLGLGVIGTGSVGSALNVASTSRANVASTSAAAAAAAAAAATVNTAPLNENGLVVEQTPEGEWSYDPNEPRYCTCNQVSYGDMVACDNDACPYEWFHYPCVGITQPPKGKWYCPKCTASMRRRGNRKN